MFFALLLFFITFNVFSASAFILNASKTFKLFKVI